MIEGLVALYLGAIGLGLLHGIEPGHGWPVAAAWALARRHPRRSGVLAASIIGLGHLISSIRPPSSPACSEAVVGPGCCPHTVTMK